MSDRIHAAGAEVMWVSVDDDERQAAMLKRWPAPHVKFVSDPDGERILKPIDRFDPDERGGIARPGLFVIDPDGNEVFADRGDDFADRRGDGGMLDALEGLGLDPIDPPAGSPEDPDVDVDQKGAFRPSIFGPYFTGNKFAALAIRGRTDDEDAQTVAKEHQRMAESMLDAWKEISG